MGRQLAPSLRDAPATVPALGAIALFIAWATDQAGYPVTHWAPGGLIVLGLLAISLIAVGAGRVRPPLPVAIALACLAAFTALSFLSILWAGVQGDAWEGADRTLLYLLVFALFACFRQRAASAALLVGTWTLAIIGLAVYVAVHLHQASSASLQSMLPGGRLVYPSGYVNANAALWLMAFWPAFLLARARVMHWGLRGLLGGGAVLLALLALLSQSRGSLYATAVMLVLVFALLGQRVRTFATLVPVAAGIAAAAPAVLRVGDHLRNGEVVASTLHHAIAAALTAAVVVGVLIAIGAALEGRLSLSPTTRRRIHRGVAATAVATLVAVLAGGWIAAGDPVARVHHAWDTFKSGRGYAANSKGNRLTSGLGSNRYDFYRVALDEFLAHPLVGIGADNFHQQYLVHGRSEETPKYPHSVELRTLTQTGLLGMLLAVVGLGAATVAAVSAVRRSRTQEDALARVVAAAALGGFAYWFVHGSVDWFWEFAGLGAPAFALLGIACSLAPAPRETSNRVPVLGRRVSIGALAVLAAAAVYALAAPWISQLEVEDAARIWAGAPRKAYSSLDDAASWDPLSDEAYSVAGSIALRFGDLVYARRQFSMALTRNPGDSYATLELGAIASVEEQRRRALGLLERAARLAPRDRVTLHALAAVRRGQVVDIEQLNRSILREATRLT